MCSQSAHVSAQTRSQERKSVRKKKEGEEKEREESSVPVAGQKWSQTRVLKFSYCRALPGTHRLMTSMTRS